MPLSAACACHVSDQDAQGLDETAVHVAAFCDKEQAKQSRRSARAFGVVQCSLWLQQLNENLKKKKHSRKRQERRASAAQYLR